MERRGRKGFTLIELLLFSAIFSVIIGAFITILLVMVNVQAQQSGSAEVSQQGQFLEQQIQYYVQGARLIDMPQDVSSPILALRNQSLGTFSISQNLVPVTVLQASGSAAFGSPSLNVPFSNPVTAGDTLIITLYWAMNPGAGTSTIASVSDTLGNSFVIATTTFATQYNTSHYEQVATEMVYATSIKGGSDAITVTWNNTVSLASAGGFETTPSNFDRAVSNTGNSTAANAGTISGANYEFAMASAAIDDGVGGSDFTPGTGWLGASSGLGDFSDGIEYQTLSSSGDITGNFTNPTGKWAASMVAFTPLAKSGAVYITLGTSTPQPFTSNRVSISNLEFTRHYGVANTSTLPYGTDSVSFSFTLSSVGGNTPQFTQTFQSSASVGAPVPQVALLQQAKAESGNISVTSSSVSYQSANEVGDILVAVVANAGSSTVNVTDVGSSTWTNVMSASYPAYTEEVNVYETTVSFPSVADTVHASFGSGASDAEMFIYEYRGVATSSPFDAEASAIAATSSAPSSGGANATSAVELLLGGDLNANTTEVPSAGSGYLLETSSSAANNTHLFIEDQDQYVTGPVASTWQYVGSPNSLAFIVTFK